jgi:hypothetical protein
VPDEPVERSQADWWIRAPNKINDPRGEARYEGNAIKDDLDAYNNSCPND